MISQQDILEEIAQVIDEYKNCPSTDALDIVEQLRGIIEDCDCREDPCYQKYYPKRKGKRSEKSP
jgi:translation initiation factor 2 beta subunit (eIF-2beta)/eIF-5